MADLKISQLNAGSPAQSGDLIPIARNVSGTETNFSVTAGSVVSLVSNATIDASSQAGSDICAQINNAWTALAAQSAHGGTVTVYNAPGTSTCAASPFTNYPANFNGNLSLAPYTIIQTAVQWALPTNFRLDGMSEHPVQSPLGTATGAVIQAQNSFPTSTPLVTIGTSATTVNTSVTNIRLSCQPPNGTAITGCTALQAQGGQENSRVENVWLDGSDAFGFDFSMSNAQQGGIWKNIAIGMSGVNNANAQCFRIGNNNASILIANTVFEQISCNGGSNGTQSTILGTVDAASVTIIGMHMEQGVTGLVIGSQKFSHAINVIGSQCSGTVAKPVTTCFQISPTVGANGVNFMGVYALASANVTNLLVDSLTNGGTIPVATEGAIGIYSRGINNTILTTSNVITSSLPTVTLNQYTVATLPSAATLGLGAQVIVTDALTAGIGTCVGGGTTIMIGVSSGSVWSCH